MTKERNFKVLDGFVLKIMALVFMTFDHLGVVLSGYKNLWEISAIFRILGRFSFPLIIFLLVEGIVHTRHAGKYFFRILLLALAFLSGQLFYYYVIDPGTSLLSPAVDLVLTFLTVYFLKRKDKFSLFAILPVAWAFICLFARNYEMVHVTEIKWVPFFLRPDYSVYGVILGIGFFYSNYFAKLFLNSSEGTKNFVGTSYEQTTKNVISAIVLIVLTISFTFLDKNALNTYFSIPWQIYAIFAAIPLFFYSGKRGYNAKWFKYGCYIYFPAHFIIIFLIFSLL